MARRTDRTDRETAQVGHNLSRWALSLPFCVERHLFEQNQHLQALAVNCEDLGIRRIFMCIGRIGSQDDASLVHLVLPSSVASAAREELWVTSAVSLVGPNLLVSLINEMPRSDLERWTLTAYLWAFAL